MCGRYRLNLTDKKSFQLRFQLEESIVNSDQNLITRNNIAPGQLLPVIIRQSPNTLKEMIWGMIPPWEKSIKPAGMINARAETVAIKPWFRKAFQLSRCLVPSSGFYEWSKKGPKRKPYHIFLKGKDFFSFAGLYSTWTHPQTQKEIQTFTIITTEANNIVGQIHNRMPVILSEEDEDTWLNPDNVEIKQLVSLLRPYPDNEMEAVPISKPS